MRRAAGVVVLALVATLVAACSQPSEADKAAKQSGLACRHFRDVDSDMAAGILTAGEARGSLAEVHDEAIIAAPAVRTAATRALAGFTQGDPDELVAGLEALREACAAAGW